MNQIQDNNDPLDERINSAIADYLDAALADQAPSREAFLDAHPDIRNELTAFLVNREAFLRDTATLRALLTSIRSATGRSAANFLAPPVALGWHGDHELIEQIGHGGMGVVYRARHRLTERVVALKVLREHAQLASSSQRFLAEARAFGRIRHVNVVQLYEVGEMDGHPFFSMEFIDGRTLAHEVQERRPKPREAALLVAQLADGLQAVHDAGVLHRDLKPSNILLHRKSVDLDLSDVVSLRGANDSIIEAIPKIADFGLAKLLGTDGSQTQTGMVIGTPEFMAPEQALGRNEAIGPATDIYSLGATLYFVLTGKPPLRGLHREDTLHMIAVAPPPPPSMIRANISPVLDAIVQKCLEKDPKRRYATAAALADDLRRFAAGKSTQVRPETRIRRLIRKVQRNPIYIVAVAIALAIVVGLGIPIRDYVNSPERERERIERTIRLGQDVELIGDSGPPRWHRWVHGAGAFVESEDESGAFTLRSTGLALLELANVQRDTFHLTAELRQINADTRASFVGLYVKCRQTQIIDEELRTLSLIYSDLGAYCNDRTGTSICCFEEMAISGMAIQGILSTWRLADTPFCPATIMKESAGWRKLVLDVSPTTVSVWFETAKGQLSHLGVVSSFASDEGFLGVNRGSPSRAIDPRWSPHGGIGIVLYSSTVSVRKVRIEMPKGF